MSVFNIIRSYLGDHFYQIDFDITHWKRDFMYNYSSEKGYLMVCVNEHTVCFDFSSSLTRKNEEIEYSKSLFGDLHHLHYFEERGIPDQSIAYLGDDELEEFNYNSEDDSEDNSEDDPVEFNYYSGEDDLEDWYEDDRYGG